MAWLRSGCRSPSQLTDAAPCLSEHSALSFFQRQGQLGSGRAVMSAATEDGGQGRRVDLVTAADTDLCQVRGGLFEKDGQLLSAERVELIDRAVRLFGRRTARAQVGLA